MNNDDAPKPEENEMLPVLIMNAMACKLGIINPTQFERYKRDIDFRQAREAAAEAAAKRGARRFVL